MTACRRPDPVPGTMLCAAIVWLTVAIALPTPADPDLWGHVRFGQLTLAEQSLTSADPFSFTSDRDWVNHEWLSEVLMATAFDGAGGAGLVALKTLGVMAAMGLAAAALWGVSLPTVRVLALTFAGLAGVIPLMTSLRPQVFSVVLFAVELMILRRSLTRPRIVFWLPVMIALWANLHGGWLVGCGVAGAWMAARGLDPSSSPVDRWTFAAAAGAMVVASLATPYGLAIWQLLGGTVRLSRPDVPEWGPLSVQPVLVVPWVLACLMGACAACRAGRTGLPAAVVGILLAAMSVRVARLVPFYCLAVALGLVPLALARHEPVVAAHVRRRAIAAIVIVGGLLACIQSAVGQPSVACIEPSPLMGLDVEAAQRLQALRPAGTILTWFDWGEYTIWHFGPALKVSYDGRRETVYSDSVMRRHLSFYAAGDGARAYIEQLAPGFVWLPSSLPVATHLDAWGYTRIIETPRSAVWALRPQAPAPAQGSTTSSCFPGP